MLGLTNHPKALWNNGSCARPQIARPTLSGSGIASKIAKAQSGHSPLKERPKRDQRPSDAGVLRFKED
ncbi:MAG: hypothetical protein AAFY71_00915 [Bacteroidota bacterium]